MSNELLKDAYRLYLKSLLSNNPKVILSASTYINTLKKIYPDNIKVDELYQKINYLISKIDFKKEKCFISDYQKFISDNQDVLYENTPNIRVRKQMVFLDNYDYNFLMFLVFDFFKNTSTDLLNIFLKLVKEGRLLIRNYNVNTNFMNISSDSSNGAVIPIMFSKGKYIIFINNFMGIDGAATLIHEIGHILYFEYNKINNEKLFNPYEEIKFEIVPRTLELLFINYLDEIGMTKEADILDEFFNQRLEIDNTCQNEFSKYKYTMADFVSMQCIDAILDKKITLKDFCHTIYKTPYDEILRDTKEFFQKKNIKSLR